eukprot:1195311-Prorocentrum_minimum.AAC.3
MGGRKGPDGSDLRARQHPRSARGPGGHPSLQLCALCFEREREEFERESEREREEFERESEREREEFERESERERECKC